MSCRGRLDGNEITCTDTSATTVRNTPTANNTTRNTNIFTATSTNVAIPIAIIVTVKVISATSRWTCVISVMKDSCQSDVSMIERPNLLS